MYFEIYRHGNLIKRGDDVLNEIEWSTELMDIPDTDMTLPITYLEYLQGREEIKIFIGNRCFWGIVEDIKADKDEETIDLEISHVVAEWNYRQISVNNAIKDKAINIVFKEDEEGESSTEASVVDQLDDIYSDTNFAYPGWKIDFQGDSGAREIDYVYSRQGKLEALTQTCELTPDLFWRVGFEDKKEIEIGAFGEIKPYTISARPQGATNIELLEEPTIGYDFENVINLATVYSEKSDSGMSSLTLREVYNDPSLQLDGFPVIILRSNVNNERDYRMYSTQYPTLAPNNELEFAVLDEESVALEGGVVIEGTYAFNDLGAFNTDSETITDADRITAAKTAYEATIRKLKQARRSYQIEITVGEMPPGVNVGDRVRFQYDNLLYILGECSNYWKKILSYDELFYITRMETSFGKGEIETNRLTLEKFLKINRETTNQ